MQRLNYDTRKLASQGEVTWKVSLVFITLGWHKTATLDNVSKTEFIASHSQLPILIGF